MPLILQYLPSDGSQPYTLLFFMMHMFPSFVFFCITSQTAVMPVVSTLYFCLDFTMIFIPFGVLASIHTPAVNVTINLYQNYSECQQLLSKHTGPFSSIFNAPHKKLWILASVLATFFYKGKIWCTAHSIFQGTRRILNIPSSIQPCEGKMLFDFWNFKNPFTNKA